MKKVLILGIGNAQVDIIKLCKEKGFEVHTCSNTALGRGLEFSDHFQQIDIVNKEAVLEYAKNRNIDLAYSMGSDIAMPTASYVSEQLQLPYFVSSKTATLCNTKQELRGFIGDEDYNLKFQEIASKEEAIKLPYPLMMKPVDSQGQRGIIRINSREEFEAHFDVALSYSRSKKIILEEFVEGPEISVNVYMIDGEVRFALISDRISWPQYPGGIIHKHLLPSGFINEKSHEAVNRLIKSVTSKLEINNGPAYFQIKLKGEYPKLIEVTPRLDGCHMWRLIKESTGVDLLYITINHLSGNDFDALALGASEINKQFVLEFICKEPGSVVEEKDFNIGQSLYLEKYYKPGEKVKPVNNYMEKIGYFIVSR